MKRVAIAIVTTAVLGLAIVANAQSKCDAAKAKAAGNVLAALMKCHAKALKKGAPINPDCPTKALDKLAMKYANSETATDCSAVGDITQATTQIQTFVDEFFSGANNSLTCCQIAGGGLCYDVRGQGLLECQTLMGPDGLDGAPGSLCDAETGTCGESAQGGNCCGLPDDNSCRAGPSVTQTQCEDDRGLYTAGGVCLNTFCVTP